MRPFRCPRCGGGAASRMGWPHPLILAWVLNPALALNELVLGQCQPKEVHTCETCPGPKAARAYVGCVSCGAWHPSSLWSKRLAFGHWAGYICRECGGVIPRLWNVWSFAVLIVLAPLWWYPVSRYRDVWLRSQWLRIKGAAPLDVGKELREIPWLRIGVLYWGVPVGLSHALLMAWFFHGPSYWASVGWFLRFMPLWLVGGGAFAALFRWAMTR